MLVEIHSDLLTMNKQEKEIYNHTRLIIMYFLTIYSIFS